MGESTKCIFLRPTSVEELASSLQVPVNMLILTLLKQGIVATKNQILDEATLKKVAKLYEVEVVAPKKEEYFEEFQELSVSEEGSQSRLPVVVVVGHVDHGKTTLLDYVRKAKVAAGEVGGITQHISAYRAKTSQGDLVFLDTPGHEAFSLMRVRGIAVADIAILVVAADDGVMPQTIEALDHARDAGLPVVVAINKSDKVDAAQIEKVKGDLARYNLLPEDWGGDTVCVSISALKGQGVDELLEVVALQAEMLELTASLSSPAKGYILESHLERGRGPVATVITRHGSLRVGDFFACGDSYGRVSSLRDSQGRTISSVAPSVPVIVAGFSGLPQAGDVFTVVGAKEAKRGKRTKKIGTAPASPRYSTTSKKALNVLIKSNTTSSKEALVGAIEKLADALEEPIHVLSASVGTVTESDVAFASDTQARILGLHVKVAPGVTQEAHRAGVEIQLYDIIYKLLEDLQDYVESQKPVKTELRKIGTGTVLKVFDIKKVGVVAGSQMTNGYCSNKSTIVGYRGNKKIVEGSLESLQRERKSVKEVKKGQECAFMIKGFSDWQENDTFECYLEVPVSS